MSHYVLAGVCGGLLRLVPHQDSLGFKPFPNGKL